MFEQFKRFFKHSTIYAFGNALNRAAAFLLLPLYTRFLTPEKYGILELFYVTAAIFQAFLGMMLAHSALRFYFEYDDERSKKAVMSTAFLSSFALTLAVLCASIGFVGRLSVATFQTPAYANYFLILFGIILFDLTKEIPLALLRAEEKSAQFIAVSIGQLVLQVIFNVYTVVYMNMGVAGILIGNFLSIFIAWTALAFILIRHCGISINLDFLIKMLKYGYPFVLATVGVMVINVSDRFFIKAYSTLGMVGLYALGTKFGTAVKTVLLEPFMTSFGPFRFSIMKNDNARAIYSRILTYFTLGGIFLSLAISIFSKEMLMVLSGPEFWGAYTVVPIVVLTIVINGICYVFQTGIFLTKRTKYVFYITVVTALATLALNWLMIPLWSMYGAAIAGLIAALVSTALTYSVSQRIYAVEYEFLRIGKIFAAAFCIYIMSLFVSHDSPFVSFAIKLAMLATFPFILAALKFYKPEELSRLFAAKDLVGYKFRVAFDYIRG